MHLVEDKMRRQEDQSTIALDVKCMIQFQRPRMDMRVALENCRPDAC